MNNNGLDNKGYKELIDIEKSMNIRADDSKTKQKVCKHYMRGQCWYSDDKCPYLHANIEDKQPICKYFKENGFCNRQNQCPYQHTFEGTNVQPVL